MCAIDTLARTAHGHITPLGLPAFDRFFFMSKYVPMSRGKVHMNYLLLFVCTRYGMGNIFRIVTSADQPTEHQVNVTKDNYYSSEAGKAYLSNSQFNAMLECSAKAMAELEGRYVQPDIEHLLVGQYTHMELLTPEGMDEWMKRNGENVVSQKTKRRYAAFDVAQRMIDRVKVEPDAMALLSGEHERIITFDLGGAKWKAQLDVADFDPATPSITDLKTAKDFEPRWDDKAKTRVPWYEGYWRQMAVYRAAYKSVLNVEPALYVVGVSKQEPSAIALLNFDNVARLDAEIAYIESKVEEIVAIKDGKVKPTHCGTCAYCRIHKPITLQVAESLTWPTLAD